MEDIKIYKQLPIPEDSKWDRKRSWYTLFKWWIHDEYSYGQVYRFFDKYIFTPISDVSTGFTNFKNWYKVIWFDRNWDMTYIYKVLERKIELQRKELVGSNRFVGVEIVNRDMTICLNLLQRIQNDYYGMEHYDYNEINTRFEPCLDKPGYSTMESDIIWEKYDDYLKLYPLSVRYVLKNNPDIDKQHLCLLVGYRNHEKAEKLLFRLLHEKINSWWD